MSISHKAARIFSSQLHLPYFIFVYSEYFVVKTPRLAGFRFPAFPLSAFVVAAPPRCVLRG